LRNAFSFFLSAGDRGVGKWRLKTAEEIKSKNNVDKVDQLLKQTEKYHENEPKYQEPEPVNEDTILFIQTGGTIDKGYPRMKMGYAFEILETPAVKEVLSNINHFFKAKYVCAARKDSSELTAEDRIKILECCLGNEKKVLITHGTDTMIETGLYLDKELREQHIEKTIVLTGSMKPEKFKDSDAAFNVGVAVGCVQVLNSGIYVCMNGQCVEVGQIERGIDGRFWRKSSKQSSV